MGSIEPQRIVLSHGAVQQAGSLHGRDDLFVGIDIGSTSSDIVVLDDEDDIVLCDYQRTKGRPIETVLHQLHSILAQVGPQSIALSVVTGSVGRLLATILDITFVNEVPAQAAAVGKIYPHLQQATIIEMGGQDSKLIFLSSQNGQHKMSDFTLNTVCAAGTGSFLDQQASRLGIDIETEFGQLALQSKVVPRMAGRCSVFAKSDMIHLQQQATPTCDIIAGLCLALARNLKSDLGCGRRFVKPIIFTGGVAANVGVIRALEQVFELAAGELLIPKEHFFTGAIGAVLLAKSGAGRSPSSGKSTGRLVDKIEVEKIESYLSRQGSALQTAPRRQPLAVPSRPLPKSMVYEHLLLSASESRQVDAYLGVDVGSISTNVAVIDEQNRLLAKAYLMTAGKPLEAARQGLDIVGKKVAGKVKILGAATTGSGRYLTGDFIGADVVINEITAQATGALIVNPKVDTIFEIGGQDSKYISLENGVVVDFEMNHACAAGTGSFLEEQAQRLGIKIERQFEELAMACPAPIKLGERCTVFMESDLLNYQQQGAQTGELVAGLSYSIVANYLNRVVGRRKIGNNICFQGGTAFNKAVWAAFEQVTGRPIMVPDHHEVTGAIGAAAIAAERMKKIAKEQGKMPKSSFRGFENLVSVKYSIESFTCEHCPNHCEIKKVELADSQPLCYGSRCDRYNIKKEQQTKKGFDAFEFRREKLFQFAGLSDWSNTKPECRNHKSRAADHKIRTTKIGIPMALINWQLLPLFATFFGKLGFEVVLSGQTTKRTIRMGVESVTAQPCFPVKVAYGHIAELIEKKVDCIFLPSIVSMTAGCPRDKGNQLCPYVQSFAYQVATAFAGKFGHLKVLTVPMHLGEGKKLLQKSFTALGKKLGVSASAVRRAMKKAFCAQAGFENALKEKGREILRQLDPNRRLFVLISRSYNGCDEGVNLQLPAKLAELGAEIIPMDMLDLDKANLGDESLRRRIYWSYGQKILKAAEIIKNDPRLFAVYLSNFSCGPDSFLLTFFRDIMAPKPALALEIDEHSADAGVITRLEAFLESLKNYRPPRLAQPAESLPSEERSEQINVPVAQPLGKTLDRRRTLYVPYMSDCSYGLAACFRAHGQPADVMPKADETILLRGRRFTSGKECLPCAITAGEMLEVLSSDNVKASGAAFFMPGTSGPCRFGMYNCLHRLILKYAGAEDALVISPNQDEGFYKEFAGCVNSSALGGFMKDAWVAMVGIDLLAKLILRLRPLAADAHHAQQVYQQSLEKWTAAIEKGWPLAQMRQLMSDIAAEFAIVELDPVSSIRKPRIGVVGEIYVRNHPFANSRIIARLEQLGAATSLASLAEWIYYTNFARKQRALRRRQFRNWLTDALQDYLQHRIEKTLAEPLEKNFGRLTEGSIEHVIELASPYLHHSFEGEAILSIGKTIEYYHNGIGGVVNVMPFTCMPSTIVGTQTQRISQDCAGMPILNISFDGQEDSTLMTRLEAFVEQVRQRQTISNGISRPTLAR